MVLVQIPSAILGFIENSWYNKNLINYSSLLQAVDFLPFVITAAIGGTIAYFSVLTIINPWLQIITGGIIFSTFYIFISFMLHKIPQDIIYLLRKALPFIK